MSFASPGLVAFLASFFACLLIVKTPHWHGIFSMDSQHGIQRQHLMPTPRVGGVAIWLGMVFGTLTCTDDLRVCVSVWAAGTPVFVIGLAEDLFKTVGVRARLMASMLSGLVGWWLTGYTLNHLHWPLADPLLLEQPALALALTCFAVAGVTNALNIVDGFNGIAGGTALVITAAFLYIAQAAGDHELVTTCWVLMGALGGFLVLNWPQGRLFLGDGGAYLAGCSVAWLAVMLNARIPDVSAWALLLICFYPIQEVKFSIWRRRQRRRHWGHPDRLHLHSLVGRRLIRFWLPTATPLARNSATGLTMLFANALPIAWALSKPDDDLWQVTGLVVSALVYRLFYMRLCRFSWRRPTLPRTA